MRSVAEYDAPALTPWISATNLATLKRAQQNTAETITGQVSTTATHVVHQEAYLPPLTYRYQDLSLRKGGDRARLPSDDKIQILSPQHLKRVTGEAPLPLSFSYHPTRHNTKPVGDHNTPNSPWPLSAAPDWLLAPIPKLPHPNILSWLKISLC